MNFEWKGEGYLGGSFHGETLLGGREFSIESELDFAALFKKTSFSAESKEQN